MEEGSSKRSVKAGLPPGSLVHIGKIKTEKPGLHLFCYDAKEIEEIELDEVPAVLPYLKKHGKISWLDLTGINHVNIIEETGKIFSLHPLVLEDIVNTEQRPKFEDYEDYIYITLRKADIKPASTEISFSQISIVFGENFVITYQEQENDLFDTIKKRLLSGISRARTRKPDFLVYLIIDSIVDSYFTVVETMSDVIESTEDTMLNDEKGQELRSFQDIKRSLSMLFKSLYPLREALSKLEKRDNKLIHPETLLFFRDVYDHTIHLVESIENQRDILSGVMDIYLSNISNRMNSVMKVLTIIATIFIPLSFISSIYGMNFQIPELAWKYGYFYFWILILVILGIMLAYFKRRKWL